MVTPLPPLDTKISREEDGSSGGRVRWTVGILAELPLLEPQVSSQTFVSRVNWSFGILAELPASRTTRAKPVFCIKGKEWL
ncbi:hypothetical protein L195_g046737 [Trifolium pratense]|uniref:Uncharacterized protein n=1 Tax=Trifolium pratense TaxID=57577 RepID=A0A2K3MIK4_TRIPR|nr:hypothetical protein L195_g046737 [Trifolium pratense]